MYCTSTQMKLLSDSDFISFEQKGISKFPQPYVDFMKTYGIGTYGGAICIGAPDFDILKNKLKYYSPLIQGIFVYHSDRPSSALIK